FLPVPVDQPNDGTKRNPTNGKERGLSPCKVSFGGGYRQNNNYNCWCRQFKTSIKGSPGHVPACAGSGEGSSHFGSIVRSLS
uniref:Uncharacterized protein n=1 Tax=Triticum urartu TaxID=4572 RepID=A0A8R7PCE9_TRIUA